jgi:hypothetical protein
MRLKLDENLSRHLKSDIKRRKSYLLASQMASNSF